TSFCGGAISSSSSCRGLTAATVVLLGSTLLVRKGREAIIVAVSARIKRVRRMGTTTRRKEEELGEPTAKETEQRRHSTPAPAGAWNPCPQWVQVTGFWVGTCTCWRHRGQGCFWPTVLSGALSFCPQPGQRRIMAGVLYAEG